MFNTKIFVLLAICVVIDGSALVRFINTVPTRLAQNPSSTSAQHVSVYDPGDSIDRVGLQYFADNGVNTLNSPTIVWTETMNDIAAPVKSGTAPYPWIFAMPPLRRYGLIRSSYASAADRVAAYTASQIPVGAGATNDPSAMDNYDQTFLKWDGVGLYLSFAAGTYRTQAYGVLGKGAAPSSAFTNPAKAFSTSLTSLTFQDNTVYTIVATGNGMFGATPSMSGATVTLVMFVERVDPTTFGMASLRYFHAIQTQSTSTLELYNGQNPTTADKLASALAFGSVSPYTDVKPNTNMVLSITVTGSSAVIAPGSTGTNDVTADVRAGLRATVICAVTDSQVSTIFCRMIPSRVVAYVRMVNDLAGQQSYVQDSFGSAKLSMVKLSLWASYEMPNPIHAVEMSQSMGNRRTANHPGFTRGLYGVLSQVGAGDVTGYGEVYVPVMIMDFALRFTIVFDNDAEVGTQLAGPTAPAVSSYSIGDAAVTANRRDNQQNPTTSGNNVWFWGAPFFKRCHFVVKTAGFSTLSGFGDTHTVNTGFANKRFYAGAASNFAWTDSAVLLDEYMEPGQYYTLFATSPLSLATATGHPFQTQVPDIVRYYWRLDKTIDQISSGIPNGQARIAWVPFGDQNVELGTLTLRGKSSNSQQTRITLGAASTYAVQAGLASAAWVWNTPAAGTQTDAGPYRFDYVAGTENPPATTFLTPKTACRQRIPSPTDVNLASGTNVDVFVLNVFGCFVANEDVNKLSVVIAVTQSAIVTGHANSTLLADAQTTSTPVFFAAAPATTVPATFIALLFAVLIALLF